MADRAVHVGIYVADDQIIVGVHLETSPDQYRLSDMKIDHIKHEQRDSFKTTFERSLKCAAAQAKKLNADIQNVLIAIPGPVQASGIRNNHVDKFTSASDYGIFRKFIRRQELANINVMDIISQSRLIHPQGEILIYHDAATYAFGDFITRRNKSCFNQDDRDNFRREERHFLLLVDEGVGGALIHNGAPDQGPSHPEIGHIIVQRHPLDFSFKSSCHVHKRPGCLESLVGLPSLRKRWKTEHIHDFESWFSDLEKHDDRLYLVAYYISQAITNAILFYSPTRVVLSGRVATWNENILPMVRGYVDEMLEVPDDSGELYPGYSHQLEDIRPDFIDYVDDIDCGVFGAVMLSVEHSYLKIIDNVTTMENYRNIEGEEK